MKSQDFFNNYPVFTYQEFAASVESRIKRTRDALLTYYVKNKRLLRVRRGLYATVPSGMSPDTCPVDPYLIAARLTNDAVLAYHTALELQGKAYSVWENLTYLTGQQSRPLKFRGHVYKAVSVPKALQKQHHENFGVIKVDRQGMDIHVTGL